MGSNPTLSVSSPSPASGRAIKVLIAAELKPLLEPAHLAGLEVTWLAAPEPVPAGAHVAIVPLATRWIGGTELDRLPELKVIASCAAYADRVDLVAAELHGVIVTTAPDAATEAAADLTWALILACARRLVEGLELVRSGRWIGWRPEQFLGLDLRGRTLGLVGAGRVGQAVGRRAVPFGLAVRYIARSGKPEFERETGARRVELGPLLETSDIVSLHLPATLQTRGIIGPETLVLMKPGAILINTASGELVREDPLALALEENRLGAVGLDVFFDEPRITARLLAAPRTVLLPHLGSATRSARVGAARLALANVQAVLAGRPPLTPVVR